MESNKKVVEMDKAKYDHLKSVVVWYDQMPVVINSDSFHTTMYDLIYDSIPDFPDFNKDEHYKEGLEVTEDGLLAFDVLSVVDNETVFEVVLVPKSEG